MRRRERWGSLRLLLHSGIANSFTPSKATGSRRRRFFRRFLIAADFADGWRDNQGEPDRMRAIDYFDKGAETYADRIAIIDGTTRVSYSELKDASEKIARAMSVAEVRSDGQIGARAAIYSPNDARVLFCMLGLLRAGAVWVPINSRNAADANIEYMNYVETSWLFYHSSFRDSVREIKQRVSSLRQFVCIDAECDGDPSLEIFMSRGPSGELSESANPYGNPDDLMGLVPTGGTTGPAKGVMVTNVAWGTMIELAGHYWRCDGVDPVCLST